MASRISQVSNGMDHFCRVSELLMTKAVIGAGGVSRECRKLFGSEKPFAKLQSTYSVKLDFSYVVNGIKVKITAKFRASRRLRFADTKRVISSKMCPESSGTFEKRASALSSICARVDLAGLFLQMVRTQIKVKSYLVCSCADWEVANNSVKWNAGSTWLNANNSRFYQHPHVVMVMVRNGPTEGKKSVRGWFCRKHARDPRRRKGNRTVSHISLSELRRAHSPAV